MPQARAHLLDDLGVERLAGADQLAQRHRATRPRSSWISIRQTVGGAQSVVTPQRTIASSSAAASKRA